MKKRQRERKMRTLKDIEYKTQKKLDIYLPDSDNFDTIVYFHGGGIENGKKDDENYVGIAKDFTAHGYAFISVEYSLYPNAKFPEYILDCAEGVKFAKDNILKYGGNGNLYISGQSAGAWISLMLCLNKEYLSKVGVDSHKITGWIIDSAQTTAHFNVIKYETGMDSRLQLINEYAPLNYVDKDTKFSKMLLICYEQDMPCRPEQNALFFKTVLYFNPSADIELKVLKGTHCHGSIKLDDDGRYEYVKTALTWLNKKSV